VCGIFVAIIIRDRAYKKKSHILYLQINMASHIVILGYVEDNDRGTESQEEFLILGKQKFI
jgi:hypothetical protein